MNPTPWGFSAYDDLRSELEQDGIPANQIAVMGDADSDAKKQALFERVRQGRVRVLIGSTAKMGTGTNVQKRLVALHHLDAPWKPAEVEQREGRILRQGNRNDEVSIHRYVTEGSFDAYMWQALETKARFIAQVMNGDTALRSAEDIGGQELSYAEVKAIASGNPAVLTLAETEAELQRLAILRKNHADGQYLARRNLKELPQRIEHLSSRIEKLSADASTAQQHERDPVTVGHRTYSKDDALAALGHRLDSLMVSLSDSRVIPLGRYRGLTFGIVLHAMGRPEAYLDGALQRRTELKENPGPRAVFNALDRLIESGGAEQQRAEQDKAVAEGQLRDYRSRMGKEFAQADYVRELSELRDRLQQGLAGRTGEGEPTVAEVAEQIGKLRSANKVDGVDKRPETRTHHSAERPVTARIRERLELVPESDVGTPHDTEALGHFAAQEKLRKQQAIINEHA